MRYRLSEQAHHLGDFPVGARLGRLFALVCLPSFSDLAQLGYGIMGWAQAADPLLPLGPTIITELMPEPDARQKKICALVFLPCAPKPELAPRGLEGEHKRYLRPVFRQVPPSFLTFFHKWQCSPRDIREFMQELDVEPGRHQRINIITERVVPAIFNPRVISVGVRI